MNDYVIVLSSTLKPAGTAMSESQPGNLKSPAYRRAGRPGVVGQSDVDAAADALFFSHQEVTADTVIARTGGSKSTVGPMLKDWRRRLPARIQRGPEAFERLPAPIAHIVEALFLHCLDEARSRVREEEKHGRDALSRTQQNLEVRSHVLASREQELNERLARRDTTIATLQQQVNDQTSQLRKHLAMKDSLQRRIEALQAELERMRAPRTRPRKKAKKRATRPAASRTRRSKPMRARARRTHRR